MAGDYLVIDALTLGFSPANQERLFLLGPTGKILDGHVITNKLRGRSAQGEWLYPSAPTFGGANTIHLETAVVINEIMYKNSPLSRAPYVEDPEGWVELYNRSAVPVNIDGWKLKDGISYTFPAATVIGANDYLVVAKNQATLKAKWPEVANKIVGNYSGNLSGKGELITLEDAFENPADSVLYSDGGRWPSDSDGGGTSLELRDPDADNALPESWQESDEAARGSWQTFSWSGTASNFNNDPAQWNEFIFGLLEAGTFLIDDISVTEGEGGNLIQNGTFEGGNSDGWRLLGTHARGEVVSDPSGGGKVLRVVATGGTEHMHNHVETTLKSGGSYQHISSAVLSKSRFDGDYLDGQYEDGAEGMAFKYEAIYHAQTTDTGGVEGLKRPEPDGVVFVAVGGLGDSKEHYRWHWLPENNEEADDFGGLISFLGRFDDPASGGSASQYFSDMRAMMDLDQWLRTFALHALFGVADNYGTGVQHNAIFYERPSDGRFLFLPHDLDRTFQNSSSSSLGTEPWTDVGKFTGNDPVSKRVYFNALYEMCQTTYTTAFLVPWAEHYEKFTGRDMSEVVADYVGARRTHVLNDISSALPPVAYAITTPTGGTTSDASVTIEGTGWVDIHEFRLAGSQHALSVDWIGSDRWRIVLPIEVGPNHFNIEAYSVLGILIGSKAFSVTGDATSVPAVAGKLVISELMYNPSGPTTAENGQGFDDAQSFEYVELQNISPTTLVLTGVKFTAGIIFSFSAGTEIAPWGRLVLSNTPAAFVARYGAGITLAPGGYAPANFSNGGELVVLSDADGLDIVRFTYDDTSPWPTEADGPGYALVLSRPSMNPSASNSLNWRLSTHVNGNPGTSDATTFAGDPNGDNNQDGVSNLLHYISTGDAPYVAPSLSLVGGQIVFTYHRNLAAEDVSLTANASADLGAWGGLPVGFISSQVPAGDGTVVVTASAPMPAGGSWFFRLLASPVP